MICFGNCSHGHTVLQDYQQPCGCATEDMVTHWPCFWRRVESWPCARSTHKNQRSQLTLTSAAPMSQTRWTLNISPLCQTPTQSSHNYTFNLGIDLPVTWPTFKTRIEVQVKLNIKKSNTKKSTSSIIEVFLCKKENEMWTLKVSYAVSYKSHCASV